MRLTFLGNNFWRECVYICGAWAKKENSPIMEGPFLIQGPWALIQIACILDLAMFSAIWLMRLRGWSSCYLTLQLIKITLWSDVYDICWCKQSEHGIITISEKKQSPWKQLFIKPLVKPASMYLLSPQLPVMNRKNGLKWSFPRFDT